MAVTNEQKIDFLLKKIGFTKTKTGSVVGTGAITGTPKQPFAEAIPSPLVVPNSSLWNEAGSIPATPPGSDTNQVKVYLAASSGLRMTADATSSGQRAYIAYSTYGNTSSTRLTNWIDTQFGASYLIKVYKGDPNSGGVALSAAGSGANDGWFFDYSAGVLNFNDTIVPSGVTDTNIYIVGYRYIGQTGAPTSGISTFSHLDLTVERNLDVGKQGGISTFRNNIDANGIIEGIAGENKIPSLYANLGALPSSSTYHGMFAHVHSTGRGYFAHAGNWLELVNKEINGVVGTGTETYNLGALSVTGNVSIGGTLTYEDVKNVDAVGLITARSGIRVTGGVIEAQAGENKIPSLYAAMGNLPSAGSYHGMFAHVHATGRGYFAHAGNWLELVNKEVNGVVGTGTERYNIGPVDLTTLDVSGISTFAGNVDINADIDVDGHTNLDNVSVSGVATFGGNATFATDGYFTTTTGITIENTQPGIIFSDTTANPDFIIQNRDGSFAIRDITSAANRFLVNMANGDVTVTGDIDASGDLDVDGHTNLDNVSIAGFTTITQDLDVDGHTNLDNVSIAGVTTTAGLLDINNGGQANTFKVEDLTSGRVVLAGTGGELEDSANLTFDGNNLFVRGINIIGGGATSVLGADIVTRNFKATGISTFVGAVQFDSTIKAGGSNGTNGQYLKSTGSGVAWDTFPSLRTKQTFTASSGQTTFSMSYTIGFLDVYVNGVKLTDSEFTATNGSTIVLAVGCFVGDIVELVAYNTVSAGGGAAGIGNLVEDLTPQLGGDLDLFNKSITGTGNINITGVITATKFVGDGSGLTGLVASGSGVIVKDSGSTVGTAGTINFGDNLSVSPISAGIVTITGSAGVTTSQFDVGKLHVSGITTFVGITTFTNEVSFRPPLYGKVNFYGSVEGQRLRWQNNGSNVGLYFNDGVASYYGSDNRTKIEPHGNGGSSDHFRIWQYRPDGKENQLMVDSDFIRINGAHYNSHQSRDIARINYHDGTSLYHFGNKKFQTSGVGVTVTGSLDVSEVRSDALSLKNASGGATYATFSNGGASVLKWNNTDRLETTTSGVTVTGTVAATSYTGDGSQLTGVGVQTSQFNVNKLNVSGITTFNNDVDFKGGAGTTKILFDASQDALEFADSATLKFGDHSGTGDYSISYVNGSDFTILGMNGGSGDLVLGTFALGTTTKTLVSKRSNNALELYFANNKKLETTNTGVTVTGTITATSFSGDGSGLTNVIGSGSGVVVKDSGSTVGTAGTINFADGLDVTDISAGIVTVSTATTSITSGNSTLFVNDEKDSSNNGSFELFLNDNTYSGGRAALKIYQPSDNNNAFELFRENTALYSNYHLYCGFAGGAYNALHFKTKGAYNYTSTIKVPTNKIFQFLPDGSTETFRVAETYVGVFKNLHGYGNDLGYASGTDSWNFRDLYLNGGVNAVGVVTASAFVGDGSQLTGISGGGGTNVGITTNLSGSFTASAGTPATINTLTGYSANDLVVEYTIYIKNGSDFQTQKLLAMRDGTTIHSTQFAVMFSSSLLVQCDATISSGNILLRATPETGVSGSTTYKIKREVM